MAITFQAESTGPGVVQYGARLKIPQANPKVRILVGRFVFDSSYPAGGYPINNSEATAKSVFGINTVLMCNPSPGVVTATGNMSHLTSWNRFTGKVQVWTALGTEVAGAVSLAANSCDVIVVGY